jgi:hypothetical protein
LLTPEIPLTRSPKPPSSPVLITPHCAVDEKGFELSPISLNSELFRVVSLQAPSFLKHSLSTFYQDVEVPPYNLEDSPLSREERHLFSDVDSLCGSSLAKPVSKWKVQESDLRSADDAMSKIVQTNLLSPSLVFGSTSNFFALEQDPSLPESDLLHGSFESDLRLHTRYP